MSSAHPVEIPRWIDLIVLPLFNLGLAFAGGLLALLAIYGMVLEPADDPDAGHGHHDDHHGPDDGPEAAAESPEGDADKEATLVD